MFEITPTKTFMDSVHGYINIPKCFVDNIINTELFQRLRNIDQTGMRVLYPDAKHDRFGHSLGVFHLGSKAVDALLSNFSDDIYWKISSDNKKAIFWAKNKMLFLLACLLHDIGHAPFSHSLEGIVLSNSFEDNEDGSRRKFGEIFQEKFNSMETMGETIPKAIKAAPHEILGAMLILEKVKEYIGKIYDELIENGYPQENSEHVLYAEHYQSGGVIDKSDLNNDICFIVRMITGLKYEGFEPEKQIRNCFIELLNGGNFDVDKLDYIVRDTKMSGISNINIDIERLLKSVCIVLKTKCVNKKFDNRDCSNLTVHSVFNLSNSENEFRIVGNFNGTFKFIKGAKVFIGKNSTFISLSNGNENTKIKYVGVEDVKFSKESKIYRDGNILNPRDDGTIKLPEKDNNVFFEVTIQNAKVISEEGFNFEITEDGQVILKINGYCDLKIKGKWEAETTISFFENTYISGTIQKIEFMGNTIKNRLPNENEYSTFSVGFKKQALNIIANVLEARDYLYLWVYAHHKVIYYANFLVPVLSKDLLLLQEPEEQSEFPLWKLTYNDLEYLDDAYIWTVIKYYKTKCDGPINELCTEILSRTYKISMYKSLAEYELIFEAFTIDQRKQFRRHLLDQIDRNKPCVMNEDGDFTAGYLNENLVQEIKKYGSIENISSIIYVDANYKPKNINTHETYIIMQGESISVNKIPLLENKNVITNNNSTQYFYLYYCSSTISLEGKSRENIEVKAAIKGYCKKVTDSY